MHSSTSSSGPVFSYPVFLSSVDSPLFPQPLPPSLPGDSVLSPVFLHLFQPHHHPDSAAHSLRFLLSTTSQPLYHRATARNDMNRTVQPWNLEERCHYR